MTTNNLDEDEKDILESFERGEWVCVPNLDAEKKRFQETARQSMKKDNPCFGTSK